MDFEEEPMDVDLSGNSLHLINAMDISYNDFNSTTLEIKVKDEILETSDVLHLKENISDQKPTLSISKHPAQATVIKRFCLQRKHHKTLSNTALSIIITVISLVSLLMYHIVKFECSKDLDLKVLKESLVDNVFGQSQAIEHIINSLEIQSSSKILFLYGGTGVGKTLTISLISENLHQYANVYHYTMPSFYDTFSTDLMLGLTFCPTSTIIVDDLNSNDMHIIKHISKVIEKSENLKKNITLILVFNCDTINDQYVKNCDNSFKSDLQKAFKEIKALKEFIRFNSLTENHLRRCIEKELESKNISDEEFKTIVKNFNVSIDGCKGVYTKIKFIKIS